jgi:sugar transferase (PEP-CTERM/EpsH1 system associated)
VHVIYSFGIGGLEKGITTLINHGSPEIEHIIISLCGNRESEKFLHRPAKIVSLNKQHGNSAGFIWNLAQVIRRIHPDVVHTRNWSGMDGILAAKLAGVKTIIHGEHGWDMFDPEGTSRKRQWVRRMTARLVTRYTCVSKQLEHWLRDEVRVKKPVVQIYNGIDTVRFRPVEPEEKADLRRGLGLQPYDIVVGIVARLDAIKNHSALFKAVDIAARVHPKIKLVVVGDGPEAARLKAEASDHIVFLGYRSDTDALMRCMDVFVLPSFNEGISNTILEAMATGLPVIASNVGGNPELVEEGVNGFLVNPSDPVRIADRIMDYINGPDIVVRQGEQGRKRADENFSIEAMVEKYEAIYNSL